ncbi:hypothetical protein [Butyrivibrio proteoclasticus]|uniref:hypothetical protein n=1 Tax=Butyrivibrio proteoclasticus TaxID=43305 RepID=UPI0005548EE1|nr:hypothetical protein [Butyrivibrio proteoclasticus]
MGKYDDIINLNRPISKKHSPMPLENRAAQFMPFAALTGFEDAISATAELAREEAERTENEPYED